MIAAAGAHRALLRAHGRNEIPPSVPERVVNTLFLPLVSSEKGENQGVSVQKEDVLVATVETVVQWQLWSLAERFIWAPADESPVATLTMCQIRLAAMLLQEAAGAAETNARAQSLLESVLSSGSKWFASVLGLFSTVDIPKDIVSAVARELVPAALATARCIQQSDALLNALWHECRYDENIHLTSSIHKNDLINNKSNVLFPSFILIAAWIKAQRCFRTIVWP
jgi:hypothetical protein